MMDTGDIIGKILRDIRVELSSKFDRNFERQAFFSQAWARHKSPARKEGHILLDKGNLRRSIKARSNANAITFSSDLPYAAIHNEGGSIKVTAKMKRYFWHKYYEAVGGFGRKKNGELRNDSRNRRLSTMAEFYQHMALMKVGSEITIPKRQFLGTSPELEAEVTSIIESNLEEYFNSNLEKMIKK